MSLPTVQQVWYNSTIVDFDAQVGWNGNRGQLSATLCDDPLLNQTFAPPVCGSPVYFNFAGWIYGGIFRDFVNVADAPGGTTYKINITDPSEILQDVQLVIDGYMGVSPINNFINIYGYIENLNGFGASQVNDTGMEYNILLSNLLYLANNTTDPFAAQYGSPITFVGNQYILDLSLMPQNLPNYRINGPIVSLLDFIAEVCEDYSLDWLARLNTNAQGQNVIQVITVARSAVYVPGAITNFIQNTTGAKSKSIGLELRNEPTAKVVLGDNVVNLNTFTSSFPSGFQKTLGQLSVAGNPLAIAGQSITAYNNYPRDFAFNYKYTPYDLNQIAGNKFPVCFPHAGAIYDITQCSVLPYWGTDVYGYQYVGTHAQETFNFTTFMQACFNDFDSIRNQNADPVVFGGTKNALAGVTSFSNSRGAAQICGKSILLSLMLYHDNVFFFSPSPLYPYNISIGELRASLESQDSWENYVAMRSDMVRNADKNIVGFPPGDVLSNKEIYSDWGYPIWPDQNLVADPTKRVYPYLIGSKGAVNNPIVIGLYGRDDLLGITNTYAIAEFENLVRALNNGNLDPKAVNASSNKILANSFDRYNPTRLNLEKKYEAVQQIASECYGKKFLLSLSNVFVKLNDLLTPVYSDDPSSDGFFQGTNILGLNQLEQLFFTNQEGKIETFVEFDSVNFIDITRLGPDDFIIKDFTNGQTYTNRNDIYTAWANGQFSINARLYLKCSVEPNLVFGNYVVSLKALGAVTNSISFSDARLIVTLPYPVYFRADSWFFNCRTIGDQGNQNINLMSQIYPHDGALLYTSFANSIGQALTGGQRGSVKTVLTGVGSKGFSQENAGMIMVPRNAAFGLKSNTTYYGPWYTQGVPGKVEFEQDSTLNPWNFNGYTNMNAAGMAKVQGVASQMQFYETGSVEFPDVPAVTLGDALIVGGPVVTNINVQVQEAGILTTYSMRSFSPSYAGMSKVLYQKLRDASRKTTLDKPIEKAVKSIFEGKILQQPLNDTKKLDVRMGTPHEMIMGQQILQDIYDSGTYIRSTMSGATVVSETLIEARPELGNPNIYTCIGGMSLEGLLRPYSTNPAAQFLPSFKTASTYNMTSGGTVIPGNIVSALNPFPSGHDIVYVVRGQSLPSDLSVLKGGYDAVDNRGMALKLPLVGVGFGLDISGNYVPGNASGYDSDYSFNVNKWKCGPIDLRWSPDTSTWVGGNGGGGTSSNSSNLIRCKAEQLIQPYGSGSCSVFFPGTDLIFQSGIKMLSWLGQPICSGQRLYALHEGSTYYINISEYSSLSVITGLTCVSGVQLVSRNNIYFPSAYASG